MGEVATQRGIKFPLCKNSKFLEICCAVPCMWLTVLYYSLKTLLRVNLSNVLVTIKTIKTSNKNKKATLQFICFAGRKGTCYSAKVSKRDVGCVASSPISVAC